MSVQRGGTVLSRRTGWSTSRERGGRGTQTVSPRALSQRKAASRQAGGRQSQSGPSPPLRTPSLAKASLTKSAQLRRQPGPRSGSRRPRTAARLAPETGPGPHRKSRLSLSISAPSAQGSLPVSDISTRDSPFPSKVVREAHVFKGAASWAQIQHHR